MQSKQYFTKIKNYPHEKSTEPKIVKQACRKEQAQHLQWSGRGLKVLFHATKIVFLTNSGSVDFSWG